MAVKHLAGERLQGTAAERTAMTTSYSNIPQTYYKELARTTLSSAGDVLDSGTFTAKDNLMILIIGYKSGGAQIEDMTFNNDTGNNYAMRFSENHGNSSEVSRASIQLGIDSEDDEFAIIKVRNIANKEKFCFGRTSVRGSAGAGYIGNRLEVTGKWANTSNAITRVTITNPHSGSLDTGSEIVVLGCDDDEANSGTNYWQQLDSQTSTSGSDSKITSNTFTAKKYVYFQCHVSSINNTNMGNSHIRFGASGTIDTNNNYAYRTNINDGNDGTNTTQSGIYCQDYASSSGGDHGGILIEGYAINVANKEKLVIHLSTEGMSGAGTANRKMRGTGKWVETSAQFNIMEIYFGGSDRATAGELRVWGAN